MDTGDIIFYVLDLIVFIMLARMLYNSRKVVVAVNVGGRWIIPLLFVIVAVIGFFRYSGFFRYAQTTLLLIFAGMYYVMKSGLAEEGIVSMGSLTRFTKINMIKLNPKESALYYGNGRRTAVLYFEPGQTEEIRSFLKKHSLSVKKEKA